MRFWSELEVSTGRCRTRDAVGTGCWQRGWDSAQVLPCGVIQCGVGTDEVADHIPCSHVECAFGRRAHRERDGALRTERNAMCRRLLARPDAHGLRKHVKGNRLVASLKLTVAAKTVHVLQGTLPGPIAGRKV
jgi:hypothetical protein